MSNADPSKPAMAPLDPGSVTLLLPRLKEGDRDALRQLYDRYFMPLVRVAAGRLFTPQGQGAEDVALDALLKFCRSLERPDVDRRFPNLQSRDNIWRVLVCIAVRGVADVKSPCDKEIPISLLGEEVLGQLADGDPGPEAEVAVTHMLGLLEDESLRAVAVMRMHGYTNKEIGKLISRAESTIEVKLRLIRGIWRDKGIGVTT